MSYEFEPACRRMEWLDPFYKAVWEKAFADAIPISGTFELTPRCNFNCRMCYVHLKPSEIHKYGKELTAKEWIRVAREAKEAGTTWLCITGGEPLMHPEFETIWKELTQMGFFITLQTNASMIEGKFQKLLEDYPPKGVKITLYGSNDEIYEQVCQVKNGFTKVDQGIRMLKEMKIPIQLVSTIIRQNEEDVKRMAFYAYCHQLPWVMTAGVKSSVRGADSEAKDVRVQEKLAKNKKAPARHKAEDDYLLTTKLFCGYCGAYLCGESGTSHTGNVHHYYKCVSVKKKRTECHKKSVRKEWIEDLVVSETMRMVMDDKAIEAIVSMLMDLQDRENVNLPLYEQQLREADTAIQNLLNAIQQGILTKSTKSRLEKPSGRAGGHKRGIGNQDCL